MPARCPNPLAAGLRSTKVDHVAEGARRKGSGGAGASRTRAPSPEQRPEVDGGRSEVPKGRRKASTRSSDNEHNGSDARDAPPRRRADTQKGLPRGPQALPRERVAAHQRERLVEAMVQAVSERGVVATTISDLVARAGISRRTFYEHFDNKEVCLLATYDTVLETEVRRLL